MTFGSKGWVVNTAESFFYFFFFFSHSNFDETSKYLRPHLVDAKVVLRYYLAVSTNS